MCIQRNLIKSTGFETYLVYVVWKQEEQVEAARYSRRQSMMHRRSCHPLWSAPRTCCKHCNYSDYGQRCTKHLVAEEFEELLRMQPADVGGSSQNLRLQGVNEVRSRDRIIIWFFSRLMQDFWYQSGSSQAKCCLWKVVRTSMSWERQAIVAIGATLFCFSSRL